MSDRISRSGGPLVAALRRAAARAGAPGGIRFTQRQLYYEVCRTLQPVSRLPRRPGFTVPAPIGYGRFRAALHRAGAVTGLLTGERPRPVAPPAEVFDYGLPRVLLCQHREIADMLLANRLHMESACPVFALDDLPLDPRLPDAVRRGGGHVYVLHDASVAGLATVATVRAWAGGSTAGTSAAGGSAAGTSTAGTSAAGTSAAGTSAAGRPPAPRRPAGRRPAGSP
jgi:hypothetical protein